MARTRSRRSARCRLSREPARRDLPAGADGRHAGAGRARPAAFGAAITAIQMLVGDHFAPAQGGVFTSKRVEAVVRSAGRGGRRRHRPEFLGSDRLCLCAVGGCRAGEMVGAVQQTVGQAWTSGSCAAGIPARRSGRPASTSSAVESGGCGSTQPGREAKTWPASTSCTCSRR